MKTIKFRAWHKAEKVMCEVDVLIKEGAFLIGVKPEKYSSNPSGRFCKSDEFELMQFTGIVYNKIEDGFNSDGDYKTKIDIYRHDILEYTGTCNLITDASYYASLSPQKGERFVVIHTMAGFMLENISRKNINSIEELIIHEQGFPNQYYRIHNYAFWNGSPSLKLLGNIYQNELL